ncbi:hypothetical protein [Fulvivirga sedimenti]|uniref:Cytochrome C Planctomycete-type domain-containing protein n=1 Tax=Fulvivirga sedimenti TaxID=2879465 RepID=A0A9X1HJZ6_9BACT|nr:hypothetical protein [Fulvivirga sedimenti]MCA6073569.1 hypothetical protein [Fulvivirga sedimenti]
MKTSGYILVFTALWLAACVHDPEFIEGDPQSPQNPGDIIPPVGTGIPCDPDSVYFTNDILPIFLSSCAIAGCHDAQTHEEGLILTNYQNIMRGIKPFNPGESKFYKVMTLPETDDLMPLDPATGRGYYLPQEQLDLIKNWILQGAPQNECTECVTENISYSGNIEPILKVSCATSSGCHGNGSSNGVLNTFSQTKSWADNGLLRKRVIDQRDMPPGGGLTACDIEMIRIWLDEGAQNN